MKLARSAVAWLCALWFVFAGKAVVAWAGPASVGLLTGTSDLPVLMGVYTGKDLQSSIEEVEALNSWLIENGGSGITFAGDFLSITYNPSWNVEHELDSAWAQGFVPFLNLMPSGDWEGEWYVGGCSTAEGIAEGLCDGPISAFAGFYKSWVEKGGGRRAFIAPLPEANGDWTSYASDGSTFITAFKRIRWLFEAQGVPRSSIRWVFAPNGWNDPEKPWQAFENYYPGNDYADIVAFSSYNYGGCPADTPWRRWDTFETAMEPYLQRLRRLAPSKPIFIAQTGTVDVPDDPSDPSQTKSNWILDTFDRLANYPAVRGIIYFNAIKQESSLVNCPSGADYRVYFKESSTGDLGFLNIMKEVRFGKWTVDDTRWSSVAFVDIPYIFVDVQHSHPFSGAPDVWYVDYVLRLYNAGITGGCATNPLRYCPDAPVTRAQMAVFLERGLHYPDSFAPPDREPTFPDTAGHWAEDWIEALKADGLTSGYPDGTYRPDRSVTRAEMAVFLLKAKHGANYQPPAVDHSRFSDVGDGYWAKAWIEELAAEGITAGYPDGTYRPDNAVTRAEMSVFLVKAFGLP